MRRPIESAVLLDHWRPEHPVSDADAEAAETNCYAALGLAFDPEAGEVTVVGESLEAWAQWLLAEPDVNSGGPLATAWQDANGPLEHDQRLMPYRPFVFGGSYELANLRAVDAVEAMRARGPIAQQLRLLPEGSRVSILVR